MPDQTVGNLHDLDNLDLIALGSHPRIFPDQGSARAEIGLRPVPPDKVDGSAARARCEKPSDFSLPAQHAITLTVQDHRHERAFENGVISIESDQSQCIPRTGSPVPFLVDIGVVSEFIVVISVIEAPLCRLDDHVCFG